MGDGGTGIGHLFQDGLGMVIEHLAGIRADNALGTAVQELGTQFFFQLAQLLGQGGLCNMQYERGTRQRAVESPASSGQHQDRRGQLRLYKREGAI